MNDSTTIWCNATFPDEAMRILTDGLSPFGLLPATHTSESNLVATGADPALTRAAIAFGQPDPQQVIDSPIVKWVHLTSAGYTRYDTDAFRSAMRSRGGMLTSSSQVYADPCAQHALAMVMALARQLPQALDNQRQSRGWPATALRARSRLLGGQSMLVYGYGSIARRLVELLQPFGMQLTGVRRHAKGDEGLPIVTPDQADALLSETDHVMNMLPASPATENFFDAGRLARINPTAIFYNIGRGNTVDQATLLQLLRDRKIGGAYLDVTTPEPLPADHPLWKLPNCWITPHIAGGADDEPLRLVKHFRANLDRYARNQALLDRVI
jgi:phosphoglycerate dehydrogenase-like enzyme